MIKPQLSTIAATFIIASCTLLLSACSGPNIQSGKVVDRTHHQQRMYMQPVGKGVLVPIVYPEKWTLTLQDGDVRGEKDVHKRVYESCDVGDSYPECEK